MGTKKSVCGYLMGLAHNLESIWVHTHCHVKKAKSLTSTVKDKPSVEDFATRAFVDEHTTVGEIFQGSDDS